MDLEERIRKKRGEAMAKQSLDVKWFDDSVDIYTIYSAIEQEAEILNITEGEYKTDTTAERIERLRKIDEGLQKIWLYRVVIRMGLKRLYKKWRYKKFQKERESWGSEHQQGFQREFVRRFTKGFRIPVIGRIFRSMNNFLHVNRNITGLIGWNQELENYVKNIEDRMKNVENAMGNMENAVGNIEKAMENTRDEISNIENRLEKKYIWHLPDRVDLLEGTQQEHNKLFDRHENILCSEFKEVQELLQILSVEMSNMKAEFANVHKMSEKSVYAGNVEENSSFVSDVASNEYQSIDYFDFENHFRGSREYVKNSQRIYVPYFANRKHVVDLGCGRGEFIELLMEHEIGVRGVDLYAPYAEYCKMLHLPVEHGDALCFLEQQDYVDGIFVGQVVEHISTEEVVKLCKTAFEKLEDGCYLIMETPNPTSLAIYTQSFYMDPSHKRPVHPRTLQYIAQKQGFSDVQILYTENSRMPYEIPRLSDKEEGREHEFDIAMQHVSDLLYGSQDYAVIARK